jgi:hypothetical protein
MRARYPAHSGGAHGQQFDERPTCSASHLAEPRFSRTLVQGHDHLTVAELMGHRDGTMLAKVYALGPE